MGDIKIFVSHRIDLDCETIDNPLFVNVRCGAIYDKREDISMLGDDTGDNISHKRMSYCELTVQYWAWKNVNADYYGLCHYRRYLSFSKFKYPQDNYGNVCEKYINDDSVNLYGLSAETMNQVISDYDVILPKYKNVADFPEKYLSIQDHWNRTKYLYPEDLTLILDIISRKYPDYLPYAKEYLAGTHAYFCSMFIMRKEIFHHYSSWLFDILECYEKESDTSLYSEGSLRTPGHLAERLLGIYILYLRSKNPTLRIKELQTVFFESPERYIKHLSPAFQSANTIPIVFSSSDYFAPMCSTAIQSIIDSSTPEHLYDIVVLHTEISKPRQKLIQLQSQNHPNISIRFYNTSQVVNQYNLKSNGHIGIETYYRFLIQDILACYDKVIYLDSDLICLHDIADLFEINIDGFLLAAARDPDLAGQMNMDSSTLLYLTKTLKMKDPYKYFQAGVLLLNTKMLRSFHAMHEWLNFASTQYRYSDQDILNEHCEGHVKYFNMKWNMLTNCNSYRVEVTIENAPASIKSEYRQARKNPFIIHYAGFQKPWNCPTCDFLEYYWIFAKETPFYEQLLISYISPQSLAAPPTSNVPPIGVKGALVIYFKKHLPKKLWPIARKIKKLLKW